MHSNLETVGRLAVDVLMELIDGEGPEPRSVAPALVVRESSLVSALGFEARR